MSTTYDAFLVPPTDAARSNLTGSLGWSFTPARALTVSQLGRFYKTGNTQNHTIKIYPDGVGVPQAAVATGTVLAASASDANGYKYVSITPVVLAAGTRYFILSDENNAGDVWKDNWDMVGVNDTHVALNGGAYTTTQGTYPEVVDAAGTATNCYSTPTFKFTAPSVTWYVASNGNNSNNGTATGTPFLTLAKAKTSALQDDTVSGNGGDTFIESASFTVGVTVNSYGTGKATIAPSSSTASAITFTNCDRATVTNLIITGANAGTPNASSGTFATSYPAGVAFKNTLTTATRYASPTVTNCTISGFQVGVQFEAATTAATGFAAAPGFTSPTVTGCTMSSIYDSGIKSSNGTTNQAACFIDPYFADNTMHDIAGNSSFNSGFGIFPMQAVGSNAGTSTATGVIERNLIHRVGYGASHGEAGGPACILTCYCDQITMQYNECYDCVGNALGNDGLGLDLDLGTRNSVMQYNYAHDNDSAGFYVFVTDTGNVVRFNLSIDNCSHQGFAGEISLVDAVNVQVYNNTIVGSNSNCLNVSGVRTGFAYDPPMRILNNAMYVNPASQAVLRVDDWVNVVVAQNSYWDGDGTCVFRYGGGGTLVNGLAAFRSATGLETGTGIETNPQFTNPTLNGYTLGDVDFIPADTHFVPRPGSPMKSTGVNLVSYSLGTDGKYLGGQPAVAPYTIGAFQAQLIPQRLSIGMGLGL